MQNDLNNSSQKKILILIVMFFIILVVLCVLNNTYQYQTTIKTSTIKQVIQTKKVNSLVKVSGKVVSTFQSDSDIMYIDLKDNQNQKISVTIFPDMGVLNNPLHHGDVLDVTGILSKYKNEYQIEPLSKDSIKVLKQGTIQEESYKTIQLNEIQAYVNQNVKVEPVYLSNIHTFKSKAKKEHLSLEINQGENVINAIMYEGNWNEELLKRMKSGRQFSVVGKVDKYNETYSLVVNEVKKIAEDKEIKKEVRDTIPLSDLAKYKNQTILIGPVKFESVNKYHSKVGKTHLQFTVSDGSNNQAGIIYDDVWKERDLDLMKSDRSFYIKAKVSTFQNRLSLILEKIEE